MQKVLSFTVIALIILGNISGAASIDIYATGVDNNHNVMADSTVDPHWQVTQSADASYPGPNAYAVRSDLFPIVSGPWLANSSISKWISVLDEQDVGIAPGTYVYTQTFDLTGLDPATAQLSGRFSSDDTVDHIQFNGVDIGQGGGAFNTWSNFSITSGFISGVNTLSFYVVNGDSGTNPSGFRAEVSGTADAASTQPPATASNPYPTDGATDVIPNQVSLSWTKGSGATSHNVYFGTDLTPDAGESKGNQSETIYPAGALAENTTYYWRIDEVNDSGTTPGTVWSFTTGVLAQRITVTDWTGFSETSNVEEPAGYIQQDFVRTDGSPNVTIQGWREPDWYPGAEPHYLFYNPEGWVDGLYNSGSWKSTGVELLQAEFNGFSVGDRVSITWDGDYGTPPPTWWTTPDVTSRFGIHFGSLGDTQQADTMTLEWVPYCAWVRGGGNDPSAVFTYAYNDRQAMQFDGAPETLFIEKRTDGWAYGMIDGGVETDLATGIASNWDGGYFGIFSIMNNYQHTWNITKLEIPFAPNVLDTATNPSPSDGADYPLPNDGLLNWTAGKYALSHDVYFGTSQSAVASAQRLAGDINGDGPVNLLDFAVLADQWLSDPGAVNPSADIVLSGQVDIDDLLAVAADWGTTPDATFKGNQTSTTYDTGSLDLNTTYYWRIDEVNASNADSPWAGTVWNFTTVPLTASSPSPPNGETNIWKDVNLNWTAAENATSHDVYFGIDSTPDSDPGSSEFKGNQPGTTYTIEIPLTDNTTYYWRIDEVNDYGTEPGTVWSFTTETGSRLAPEDFAILAWDAPGTVIYDRPTLDRMRACGFNIAGFTSAQYFDMIADAGLKAFLVDSNCYPKDNPALVQLDPVEIDQRVAAAVSSVSGHPALFGYYLIDEPPVSDFPGLNNWVVSFHSADPSHWIYLNMGWPYDWASLLSDIPSVDFLCYDMYGVLENGGINPYYFSGLENARDASISSGKPLWNTVASIDMYNDNPDWNTAPPNLENLRFQAYTSLAYGVKGISWFKYFSNDATALAPIYMGSKSDAWYDMQQVNMGMHRIGPVYLTLTSQNVFHYPSAPYGGSTNKYYVESISGGSYCVGEFLDSSSKPCFMVVNKSLTSNAYLNISLKSGYSGTLYYVDSSTGQLQLFTQGKTLSPGEGILLKVN